MKLKGICKIIKSEIIDGKEQVIETVEKENIINKRAVEQLVITNALVFSSNCKIALSTDAPTVSYEKITLDNVVAIGDDTLDGVTGRVYSGHTDTEPRSVTFHNRFMFPASERTINSIALIPTGATNNNLANVTLDVYSYLTLDVPMVQKDNQILNFFYKVFLDWTSPLTLINPSLQDGLDYLFLGEDNRTQFNNYRANHIQTSIIANSDDDWDKMPTTTFENFIPAETIYNELLIRKYSLTCDLNQASLYLINQHLFGVSAGRLEPLIGTSAGAIGRTFKNTGRIMPFNLASSLSKVYSQNASSVSMLYNSNSLTNSDWQPVITTDNSYDGLPTVYSLSVENAGGLGVGSYSIWKSNYSGRPSYVSVFQSSLFGNNQVDWVQRPTHLVQTSLFPYLIEKDRDRAIPFNDKWIYRWKNDTLWVSGDLQKIAIWKIFPEFQLSQEWDLAADINDIASDPDNDRIYVATETGLFEIDTATPAVNTLSTDKAKAVDVGYNGAVFAVLINGSNVGRLASSLNANWGIALDTTGITVTDWNNIIFIRVDPDDLDYKMGIMEYRYNPRDPMPSPVNVANEWFSRVHWWDNTNGYSSSVDSIFRDSTLATYYHPSLTHPFNSSFVVKDGIWIFPGWFRRLSVTPSINFPGFGLEFIRKAIADNIGLFEIKNGGDRSLGNTDIISIGGAVNLPTNFRWAAYQFDVPLRHSYNAGHEYVYAKPSAAIVNSDISSGFLTIVQSGYLGHARSSSLYVGTRFNQTVGIMEIAVDAANPTTASATQGYKAQGGIEKYNFSTYTNGALRESVIGLSGNVAMLKDNAGIINFSGSRACNLPAERIELRSRANSGQNETTYLPIIISTWGAPHIEDRTNPDISCRYGWNDVSGEWEKSDILPGKPLHTTVETLIDGLSIGWNELNPGSDEDLQAGHFYNFIHLPKSKGMINDGSFNNTFQVDYSFYLRPVVPDLVVSGTIASQEYVIPEATSDPLWLCLDYTDLTTIEITIAGYGVPATVIDTGSPNVNEILLADAVAGRLEFNVADDGKALTGNTWYLRKIHETEVL